MRAGLLPRSPIPHLTKARAVFILAPRAKPWIPITEPTMLWVAPGWRPPPYPQALACALAAHAAHGPRTPRPRAPARARARTRHYAALRSTTRPPAHVRARARTPAHARAHARAHAALRGTAQVPSRSDSLTLRFPHAQIPCKGVPRYAAGRDGVRSCGAGRGLAREGAGKCPRVMGVGATLGLPVALSAQ